MAIVNTNLIRQIGSGLDNLPSVQQNSSLNARGLVGTNNLSSISQSANIQQPTQLGVREIFRTVNTTNNITNAEELNKNIQRLATSVNNQQARIAAGTGTNIAEQYLKDEEEKDEGLLTKIFHIIDAPRNALFNGFKYASDMNSSGGFFEGFWKGLTYEEEYSGYDFAEDLGLDGVEKVAIGFLSEVFFDPLNWVTWGTGAFAKGFMQGAVSDVTKSAAIRASQEGVEELGQQAVKEGLEKEASTIVSSGLRSTQLSTARATAEEAAKDATANVVKNVNTGAGGILNKLNNILDTIQQQTGVVFNNAKMGAVYRRSMAEAASTAKLGNSLDDLTLTLARSGEYGDDIAEAAENLVKSQQALLGADDATRAGLEQTIKAQKEELIELLKPHKLELRMDAFARKGIDKDSLRDGLSSLYEDTLAGTLKLVENEEGVTNVVDLMAKLDMDESELFVHLVEKGFGERITSAIPEKLLRSKNIENIRSVILDNLLDNVAADKLFTKYAQDGMRMLGTGLGFEVPFTNIRKDMASVNRMFELGAKARTLIDYRVGANGVVQRTMIGNALEAIGDTASALFGRIPILGNAFDEATKLNKADRWAMKYIESTARGKAKLSATVAENSIESYYKILKEAGFKSSDEINDVGNFISEAIESKELSKNATIDEWLEKIKSFEDLDDTTINNRVSEQLLDLENQYKADPESVRHLFTNEAGVETDEAFEEFYERTKTGLTNDLKNKAQLKAKLMSYNEKQQRAMLEVTKLVADDFDKIGKTLSDLKLIPDSRMLEAEYWYFPHKMNLDLMLQNQMDINRVAGSIRTTAKEVTEEVTEEAGKRGFARPRKNVLGGRTEYFTLKDASTWQRKYPMSTVEVNKILKKKYGIDHMLETNAFNTYLLYALDQGKVIADAGEIQDILGGFAIKVNNRNYIPFLRSQGYTIVTRSSNVNAIQVSDKTMNAVIDYNKRAEEINKRIKEIRNAGRAVNKMKNQGKNVEDTLEQAVTGAKNVRKMTKEKLKDIKSNLREGMDAATAFEKATATDINYIRDLINKGVLPKDMDEDILYSIMDTIVNNPWQRGVNFSATDSFYNQEMPSIMFSSKLRNTDGAVQVFMGNIDNIDRGFRQVPRAVDSVKGEDFFYIYSMHPMDIVVDDLADEMTVAANKYTRELKQEYALEGYDSIRLIDKNTNASAVIPFDEKNIYFKDKVRQAEYSGSARYVERVANTTAGGYINPNTARVFVPSDDITIDLKDIPTRQRARVASLIDDDYKTIQNSISTYNKQITANNRVRDRLSTNLSNLEARLNGAADDATRAKLQTQVDKVRTRILNIDNQNKQFNTMINNMTDSRQYNFMAGLKRAKGFDVNATASITTNELYRMAGQNKDALLIELGYDSVIDHTDDLGKTIYRTLPNANTLTKQDLLDAYTNNINAINQNTLARSMLEAMTDVGTGVDSFAKIIQEYANPEMIASMERMKNRFKKVLDVDTDAINALEDAPLAKRLSKSQERLVGKLASSEDFFTILSTEDDIRNMFDITDTMYLINKTDRDIWAIPDEIVQYLNKAIKKQTNDGVKALKEIMFKFNKIWKPSVTAWRPSFGVRNLMSGYFNSFMYAGAHIFDPDITKAAIKIVSSDNLDEVIELGGKKLTLKEIKEQMILTGATNGMVVTDVSSIGEMLADQMKRATDPSYSNALRHPLKTMERINTGVEDYNRSLLYLAALKNGETFEYAGDLVKQLQFDYSDLTDFEKSIKNIMPFYTWLRKNIPLQIERFLDDPRMYMMLMRRVPEFAKEASGMSDEDWDNMPDWVKNTFPITLGYDGKTGRYRLFDTTLPYQDLASVNSLETFTGEVVSLLHPLIKTPIELFLNKNLYTGAALESYEGETAEMAIQGNANPVLNAIARVAPSALRNMPGVTVGANQLLNTFGTVRDLKYFNSTEGTGKEGVVYGSRDVGLTGSAIINYLENALFDTNQMRYYSPEKGLQNALYEKQRDLSDLIQKLEDQGYTIPDSISSIKSAAKATASTNSKGQTMINNAMTDRVGTTALVASGATAFGTGIPIAQTVKNALQAGGYVGIESTSGLYPPRSSAPYPARNAIYPNRLSTAGDDKLVNFGAGSYTDKNGNTHTLEDIYRGKWGRETMKDNDGNIYRQFIADDGKEYFLRQDQTTLTPWHELQSFSVDLKEYEQKYKEWLSLPVEERPSTWYNLYDTVNQLDVSVYNEMVTSRFNPEQMIKWFLANPKSIAWKQISVSTRKSSNSR